jgi:hypothetical protein
VNIPVILPHVAHGAFCDVGAVIFLLLKVSVLGKMVVSLQRKEMFL